MAKGYSLGREEERVRNDRISTCMRYVMRKWTVCGSQVEYRYVQEQELGEKGAYLPSTSLIATLSGRVNMYPMPDKTHNVAEHGHHI